MTDLEQVVLFRKEINKVLDALKNVKVENLDNVSINNLDEIKVYLSTTMKKLGDRFEKIYRSVPKQDITIPHNLSFKIKNIDDLRKLLGGLLVELRKKEFSPKITLQPPEVNVPEINIPEIKIPKISIPRIDAPNVIVNPEVEIDLSPLLKALAPLKYISNKKTKPISVRLTDGSNWIKEMVKAIERGDQRVMQAFSQSTGMTIDEYKTVGGIPKTFGNKKVSIATSGTAVNVSTTSVPCCEAYLSADIDAGKVLVVGGSTVDATTNNMNGIILIPGNTPMTIKTNDLKNLWVDSQEDGGVLCVSYSAI